MTNVQPDSYAAIMDEIFALHQQWERLDRLIRALTAAIAVGFLLAIFNNGDIFLRVIAAVILGSSTGSLVAAVWLQCKRSDQLLAAHLRAVVLLREVGVAIVPDDPGEGLGC